jgi:SulP family sulfate permease
MGAEGVAPQYGSFALLGVFYLTDFQLVRYIPKPAFSCLLVLAFLDMTATWFVRSYKNTKQKWEWMVAPLIVVLTFLVGLLNAVFLGVALSTFIFVASFYRSGIVKYLANGLALRSTIERGHREAAWLDQNGDLIQILVLQNYLFFGNAQSLLSYITTMFDESDLDASQNLVAIPPAPLYIIMDFAIVSGMDTSAVDLLRETITLCKNHQCRLFLSGMSQTLRSNVLYAGIKPDGKTLYFQPDLELSLGKAEDGLLTNVFHVVEQDEHDAGMRRRARGMSHVDNGFLYTLQKIDEQVSMVLKRAVWRSRSYAVTLGLTTTFWDSTG